MNGYISKVNKSTAQNVRVFKVSRHVGYCEEIGYSESGVLVKNKKIINKKMFNTHSKGNPSILQKHIDWVWFQQTCRGHCVIIYHHINVNPS